MQGVGLVYRCDSEIGVTRFLSSRVYSRMSTDYVSISPYLRRNCGFTFFPNGLLPSCFISSLLSSSRSDLLYPVLLVTKRPEQKRWVRSTTLRVLKIVRYGPPPLHKTLGFSANNHVRHIMQLPYTLGSNIIWLIENAWHNLLYPGLYISRIWPYIRFKLRNC